MAILIPISFVRCFLSSVTSPQKSVRKMCLRKTLPSSEKEGKRKLKATAQVDKPTLNSTCALCYRDYHSCFELASNTRRYPQRTNP
ncbi:hypothetical protein PoB_001413900 [Plakobranchus ocellatus]|uniref:Secreted protein n=1 Tax=Plakobranchus ocellatus TaxID=259542 RepID=A0AAV3YZQ9_9GAST|nr:hypothetical protein PoB_001413900 [Plakobranchus ocellatus]